MDLDVKHTTELSRQDGAVRGGRAAATKDATVTTGYEGIGLALGMLLVTWVIVGLVKLILR
jgi:hypothetical protein